MPYTNRQDKAGKIDSLVSIPELLKCLKIRAQNLRFGYGHKKVLWKACTRNADEVLFRNDLNILNTAEPKCFRRIGEKLPISAAAPTVFPEVKARDGADF